MLHAWTGKLGELPIESCCVLAHIVKVKRHALPVALSERQQLSYELLIDESITNLPRAHVNANDARGAFVPEERFCVDPIQSDTPPFGSLCRAHLCSQHRSRCL